MGFRNCFEKMKHFIYILMCLAGLHLACHEVDGLALDNLNNGQVAIIGHGGSGFPVNGLELPANSFESIEKAIAGFGADGIEVDVQMSADSVLFLYHDEKLASLTDCHGCVNEQLAGALLNCRYRQNIGNQLFKDHRLVKLEEVLQYFFDRNLPPFLLLDVKLFEKCAGLPDGAASLARFARKLNRLIERFNAEKWVIIESASVALQQKLYQLNPDLQRVLVWHSLPDDQLLVIGNTNDLYGFALEYEDVSPQRAKEIQAAGFRLVLYDVQTRGSVLEALKRAPEFIGTNNIVVAQEVLKSR